MKKLITGIELIGQAKDSGYHHQYYLIRTSHGKYIQLTKLLFDTVVLLQSETDVDSIAEKLSKLENKEINAEAITFLIDKKLSPLGLINDSKVTEVKGTDLLLNLTHRTTLISEHFVNSIARILKPLFFWPIMLIILISVVGLNIWLFWIHGVTNAFHQTLYQPVVFLFIIGLVILSAFLHEFGHATGCKYGGATPGRIGAGMYLLWPAFFTDLTDVYRLGRIAKIRSDIGGIYFNLLFSLLLGGAYAVTHFEPLLLLIVYQNIDILHQLLPFLRLDGYFIVADIIGVPDLFNQIGPILKSIIVREKNEKIQNLKTSSRWIVTIWVVGTVLFLLYSLFLMLVHSPEIITTAWKSALLQIRGMVISFSNEDDIDTVIQFFQLIMLLFPTIAFLFAFARIVKKYLFMGFRLIQRFSTKRITGKVSIIELGMPTIVKKANINL